MRLFKRKSPEGKLGGSREGAFKYVYVNQDGSVRELSPDDQEFLSEEFSGGDGGRPYIKRSYKSRDGWGSLSGFLPRRKVPSGVAIAPVNPLYDALMAEKHPDGAAEFFDECRAAGDVFVTNPDGSTTITRNPALSREEAFAMRREIHLERQRQREALGKFSE